MDEVDRLCRALGDGDAYVRWYTAVALGEIGDARAMPALEARLRRGLLWRMEPDAKVRRESEEGNTTDPCMKCNSQVVEAARMGFRESNTALIGREVASHAGSFVQAGARPS